MTSPIAVAAGLVVFVSVLPASLAGSVFVAIFGCLFGLSVNPLQPSFVKCAKHPGRYQNDIRPTALGKKNWLFVGRPEAGQRTAILYSIIISCLRHGHDPEAYIRDLLTRLPAMNSKDDLDALTPSRWKAPAPTAATLAATATA